MKKFFSFFLLVFCTVAFVSCEKDKKVDGWGDDDGNKPAAAKIATLNVDGNVYEYSYANDTYSVLAGSRYMHTLVLSNVKIDNPSALRPGENLHALLISYISNGPVLTTGDMLPGTEENREGAFDAGTPLYAAIQAYGGTVSDGSQNGLEYMYVLNVPLEGDGSDQPVISITEKDGVYTIVFDDALMADGNGGGNHKASFQMNGKIKYNQVDR